jgi:hypothetical protein
MTKQYKNSAQETSTTRNVLRAWPYALSLVGLIAQTALCPAFGQEPSLRQPIESNTAPSHPDVTLNPRKRIKEGSVVRPEVPPTSGTSYAGPSGSEKDLNIGGLSAPGADAMMTPDLLLVNPSKPASANPDPLTTAVGKTLTIKIDRRDIAFDKLHGLMITVTNQTDRPLVVDGDKAQVTAAGTTIKSAPLTVLQHAIIPPHTTAYVIHQFNTQVVPAAVTIGVYPTVEDIMENNKPVTERYGPDQERRSVEEERFGRRVIWPHQKTQGIIFFETADSLNDAKLQIPAATLFDPKDAATIATN